MSVLISDPGTPTLSNSSDDSVQPLLPFSLLALHEDPQYILIQPLLSHDHQSIDAKWANLCIAVERELEAIALVDYRSMSQTLSPTRAVTKFYGIVGIVSTLSCKVMILITERELVGKILNHEIYRVVKTQVIRLGEPRPLSEDDKRTDQQYWKLLEFYLESFQFYFSYTYDITHTVQRAAQMDEPVQALPMWQRADKRFFWNAKASAELGTARLDGFVIPIMDGFVRIQKVSVINDREFTYAFISRRSCSRAGARFHARGADPRGNVANSVEIEQLLGLESILSSFVQIRGSIPLLWQQNARGLERKPKIEVPPSPFHSRAYRGHIAECQAFYGKLILVNLVDKTGDEQELGFAFETAALLHNIPTVRYIGFDFHEVCRGMKFENVSRLLADIEEDLHLFGYALRDASGKLVMQQSGAVRTNCVDCLDRTNVVQSAIARVMIENQLRHLAVLSASERLDDWTAFQSIFQNAWADNANLLSQNYTGTDALKTDFTRTGKRNIRGAMSDGLSSVKRFYNQNFQDDKRQDSIEYFLNIFTPELWRIENLADVFNQIGVMSCKTVLKFSHNSVKPVEVVLQVMPNLILEYSKAEHQRRTFLHTALLRFTEH